MSERLIGILTDSFGKILWPGLTMTIPLTVISFSIGMVIAVACALAQFAKIRFLTPIIRFYIWVIRGTPLLVQLFIIFYGLPNVGIVLDAFPSAVIVFSLSTGAYCAETMRAALESVPKGQLEAGYCVGMSFPKIMWHVVLPQTFRTAFPALGNSMISMLKETSMAATISVMEMFRQAQVINGRVYESLGLYVEVALIYLAFCTILSWIQRRGEKRLASYGGVRT